jgi:hypothetical protein
MKRILLYGLGVLVVAGTAIVGWSTLSGKPIPIVGAPREEQVILLNSSNQKRIAVFAGVRPGDKYVGFHVNFEKGVARVKSGVHEVVIPAAGGVSRLDGKDLIIDGATLGTVRLDGRELNLGDYQALAIHIKGDDSVVTVITRVHKAGKRSISCIGAIFFRMDCSTWVY